MTAPPDAPVPGRGSLARPRGLAWGSLLLVVGMVAAAEFFAIKELIFPEIAALAFGAWVMQERPWPGEAWTLWFSPTLAALTGVLVLRFLPCPLAVQVGVAFVLVLLELRFVRSSMSPSFSAAILPIITNLASWIYPLCVCLMTGAIAWWAYRADRGTPASGRGRGGNRPDCRFVRNTLAEAVVYNGKLLAAVLVVSFLAVQAEWVYVVSPPLIVVFVELTLPESELRKKSNAVLLTLFTLSALAGMGWVLVVVRGLSWPLWIAAGLAVVTVSRLCRWCRVASPPAFALALLPTVLPQNVLPWYPLQVLLGSVLFLAVGRVWFTTMPRLETA